MPNDSQSSSHDVTMVHRVQIIARLLGVAWQERKYTVVGFFLGALLEISGSLASIYATAKLASLLAAFIATSETAGIWFWLWADVLAGLVTGFGFLVMSYCKRLLYFRMVHWSTMNYLTAVSRFDIPWFYEKDKRDLLNKVGGGYTWQMSNLTEASLDLLYSILRFLAITLVVAQITWWLVPLIALFLIPTLVGESRLAKMQWFVWDSKGDTRQVFWGLEGIIRQVKGQMELRTSQATNFIIRKIDGMNNEFYKEQEAKFQNASKLLVPTKVLEVAGTAVGSIVVLRQLLAHSISLERYFFLSGALLRVGGALNSIFGTLSRMQETLLFAHSYFELVDLSPEIVDSKTPVALSNNQPPTIDFINVTFVYPGQTVPVVENLNLHIKAGEHVALVGENGAGKSTIIKLLMRFYRPTSGQILVDGNDLQDVAIESWYTQLATLFQDFNQYPLSIGENIEIGRSNKKPDPKLLEKAGSFGGVNQFTKNYTHGWDTVLDSSFQKGVEPSGGQWQRVALARAFYRNANMIVLDEPTSAIDARAEYEIFNNIFEHYQDKTALIVSHRFSTVRRANRIVVIDEGKIVESGTHSQLMKTKGLYHDLFTKQAEGYRE